MYSVWVPCIPRTGTAVSISGPLCFSVSHTLPYFRHTASLLPLTMPDIPAPGPLHHLIPYTWLLFFQIPTWLTFPSALGFSVRPSLTTLSEHISHPIFASHLHFPSWVPALFFAVRLITFPYSMYGIDLSGLLPVSPMELLCAVILSVLFTAVLSRCLLNKWKSVFTEEITFCTWFCILLFTIFCLEIFPHQPI